MTEPSIPVESFNPDSVLLSIKKLLGLIPEDKSFDDELVMHINSVFMVLHQLGIGEPKPIVIEDDTALWSDVLPEHITLQLLKTYIYLKVRMVFDPPTQSGVLPSFEKQILECEWRLNHEAESNKEAVNVPIVIVVP